MELGAKRAVAVWHRRAGKDAVGIRRTSVAAFERVGVYWHMLPTLAQGRKVVWDGVTRDGKKVLDAWPKELVAHRRNDEMKLELINGSVWQVVGSDNYDSLVGSNPCGVVFSEYSLADPTAWDFIRPILAENEGWALFIYTPRGRNHGWTLAEMARTNPDWVYSLLTADDTGAISQEAIQAERDAGMPEETIQQEFYCSFEAPLSGAYFAKEMLAAAEEGRISRVSYDKSVPVETWWDLGIGDSTAIWFAQRVGTEIHVIDYYESSGEALSHYVQILNSKGYTYSDDVVPHDARARELISGKSREQALVDLGRRPTIVGKHTVADRIYAVRAALGRCWFDEARCKAGLAALRAYRKEEAPPTQWKDERTPTFRDRPLHDWASHGADAFGYGIMHRPAGRKDWDKPIQYDNRGIV